MRVSIFPLIERLFIIFDKVNASGFRSAPSSLCSLLIAHSSFVTCYLLYDFRRRSSAKIQFDALFQPRGASGFHGSLNAVLDTRPALGGDIL